MINLNEPRSEIPGVPTSPFSTSERNNEVRESQRVGTIEGNGQNILSPAVAMSSFENISPCPKHLRHQLKQKAAQARVLQTVQDA